MCAEMIHEKYRILYIAIENTKDRDIACVECTSYKDACEESDKEGTTITKSS